MIELNLGQEEIKVKILFLNQGSAAQKNRRKMV